ncbi:MAG TPA: hypothetical protein VLQ90_11705 [Pyrinomonadaceae bacterium]|jgi:hypothetical protein|nr:hypothetical protein [Pyrinomonadaceae bacterium]
MAEMTIRRVGVLSLAKMQGFLMMVIGLIIGVIYGLIFMILGATMSSFAPRSDGQAIGGVGSVVIGLIIMVAFPIFYGVMGFVGGAIGGLIYNAAAGFVGGIKIDLESEVQYAPPPPQWNPYQQA